MARNVTLGELIDDVRAEAGHSLQSNLGVAMRDVIIKVLQRQQRRLWEDFDWTHLRVERDIVVQAGQRYYDLPLDMTLERVEIINFKWGDRWTPLTYGIHPMHFDQFDSDKDVRNWPIYRWQEAENNQIEVWPIPSQNGTASPVDGVIRVQGIRNLRPLIDDSDRADLDDTLLVLYSAAEILAREKSADASLKLQMAERHYQRLRGRLAKRDTFVLSEEADGRMPRGHKTVQIVRVPGSP